jgi:hypothetical protein
MEEKIKVSVPKSILDILDKDTENFLFTKETGEPNRNLFINTLIKNFFEDYFLRKSSVLKDFNNILKDLDETKKKEIIKEISKAIIKNNLDYINNEETVTFSFKPTKVSSTAISYINLNLDKEDSISSFYRSLFISYAHQPQNIREKIIFKDTYKVILEAIEKKKKVDLVMNNNNIFKDYLIYSISDSKDELYNYLIMETNKKSLVTLRLAKVKSIFLKDEDAVFSEDLIPIFLKEIKYGPQYQFYKDENEDIKVRLTPRGIDLFKRIYLYRPIVDHIQNNNIYVFKCSITQVVNYFERFGENAIILSPKKAESMIKYFYYSANQAYRKK